MDIFLTIVILLVISLLTYFLARIVIKDMRSQKEEKALLIDGIISKQDMISIINAYITRISKGTTFSLMYIDLDKFGNLSEAFGDKEAKKILGNIATRIKKILPQSAKIARYKGDEFIIFLNNQYNVQQVADYGYKILYDLRNKTKVTGGTEIDLTGSVSIATYPNHGNSLKMMLESLSIALYQAKKAGGNTLKIYSEQFRADTENLEVYYQIKHAIERHEFQLYYQPMMNVLENKVYGYEALLRWNHPTLGVLTPDKFINIMEQTGDIHWVGNWGLESIIKASYELKALKDHEDIKMSINLSPKQLLSETIAQDFAKTVKKLKGNPKNIILEVGEFALFERQEQIFENLVKLSQQGFSIAVDGFSIDLSTLNRLTKINMDIIKFRFKTLQDSQSTDRRYLEMLLNYVKDNNKLVIAEGVETKLELEEIVKNNINIAQGYYFTSPVSLIQVKDFVDKIDQFIL